MGITGGILDKLSESIVTDSRLCARVRHKASGCSECMDVCGHDAVSVTGAGGKVVINGEKCVGCGKCLAVCPNGVFRLKSAERAAVINGTDSQSEGTGEVSFGCDLADGDGFVSLRSLAFADRRLMVRAVRRGARVIKLYHGDCTKCSKNGCLKVTKKETDWCEKLFQRAGLDVQISLEEYVRPEKREPVVKGEAMTRREFFTFLRRGAAVKAAEAMQSVAESGMDSKKTVFTAVSGSFSESFTADLRGIGGTELLDRLVSEGMLRSIHINDDKCVKCGVCVRMCPLGVLSAETETVKNKEKITGIKAEPYLCTGCGVCALACMPKAVNII